MCASLLLDIAAFASSVEKLPFEIDKDFLLGRYRASRHSYFQVISKEYSMAPPHYLLQPAAHAFESMAKEAKKDGIQLKIVSAFRTFNRQKQIWEAKYNGNTLVEGKNLLREYPKQLHERVRKILLYSAAPGSSRHHWGTDLDINSVSPDYFENGEGLRVFEWLEKHAAKFGFFRPYGPNRTKGYQEEKWHWSYYPLSHLILTEYNRTIFMSDLDAFQGNQYLPDNFLRDYVQGINAYENK